MSPENSLALALAIGVGFYIYSKQKKKELPEGSEKNTEKDAASLPPSIENLRPGVFITLKGVGSEYEDWDVNVTAKHLYKQGEDTWFELECEHEGSTLWLEVEDDNGLSVNFCHTRTSLEELDLDANKLWQLDEREAGEIQVAGKRYFYEDSDEASFFPKSDENAGEKIYYWDFIGHDSISTVHIEKNESGDFEVLLGKILNESDITVYSNTL